MSLILEHNQQGNVTFLNGLDVSHRQRTSLISESLNTTSIPLCFRIFDVFTVTEVIRLRFKHSFGGLSAYHVLVDDKSLFLHSMVKKFLKGLSNMYPHL